MARFGSLGQQYFDDSGDPLSGGLVHFYETGTTTEATTYSDEGLSSANANPVALDSAGRQPSIFFSGQLKAVLKDSSGAIVETRDPVGLLSAIGGAENLSDVSISSAENNETLVYNSSTEKWENKAVSVESVLSDVDISSPSDNQTLIYNSAAGNWENGLALVVTDAASLPGTLDADTIYFVTDYYA